MPVAVDEEVFECQPRLAPCYRHRAILSEKTLHPTCFLVNSDRNMKCTNDDDNNEVVQDSSRERVECSLDGQITENFIKPKFVR